MHRALHTDMIGCSPWLDEIGFERPPLLIHVVDSSRKGVLLFFHNCTHCRRLVTLLRCVVVTHFNRRYSHHSHSFEKNVYRSWICDIFEPLIARVKRQTGQPCLASYSPSHSLSRTSSPRPRPTAILSTRHVLMTRHWVRLFQAPSMDP